MSMQSQSGSRGAAGNQIPKGYAAGKLQQYDPQQQSLYESLFPQLSQGSQLSEMASGSDEGFAPHEDYANKQFQEFSGQLGSRFSGMGMGSKNSGAFNRQATQGAQDFASQLAMQRQGLQRQALNDLHGLSSSLLGQHPTENFLTKKQPKSSGWDKAIGYGAPILGAGIGALAGSVIPGAGTAAGAVAGANIGNAIGKGFRKTEY